MGIIHGNQWTNEDIIGEITEIIKYNKTINTNLLIKILITTSYFIDITVKWWTLILNPSAACG